MLLKLDALGKKRISNIYVWGLFLHTVCRFHHKTHAVYTEIDSRKQITDLLDRGLQ
jgi:hypothetical protein